MDPLFLPRNGDREKVEKLLKIFRVVGLIGVRQCGKTTLAKSFPSSLYFDLENPRDLIRFDNPRIALDEAEGLIIIDEIQRRPEIFPLLRHLVDNKPKQKYLVLGSASMNLIRQSSESLAGRIGYHHLGGLAPWDVGAKRWKTLWLRGGLPPAFLAADDEASFLWRSNYIATFLERDIPQLGFQIPAASLRRFWTMLAHYHGQVLNYAELGRSFGMSDMTVRKYAEILAGALMVRILQPWPENVGKRLVKKPKVYLRDSGLFHSLMMIENENDLDSHNKLGASWEGFALDCVCRSVGLDDASFFFRSTHAGAELDLVWRKHGKLWGVEFKFADAPRMTASLHSSLRDLSPAHIWIVYPGKERYRLDEKVTVLPLVDISREWRYEG
jgi:predicted AAA+ superfamily ATPase